MTLPGGEMQEIYNPKVSPERTVRISLMWGEVKVVGLKGREGKIKRNCE